MDFVMDFEQRINNDINTVCKLNFDVSDTFHVEQENDRWSTHKMFSFKEYRNRIIEHSSNKMGPLSEQEF